MTRPTVQRNDADPFAYEEGGFDASPRSRIIGGWPHVRGLRQATYKQSPEPANAPRFLTFVNAKGADFVVHTRFKLTKKHEDLIAREDTLAMPEILIPEHDEMEVNALRPLFDNVWNTFGFWGSFKYDDARERHRLGR